MIPRKARYAIIVVPALVLLGLGALFAAGSFLSAPARASVGDPPPELPVESVTFASTSGSNIHGWFIPGNSGEGAVILMHGVRGNRRAMLNRAQWLHGEGYAVLLFDFQAHGESSGEKITFGYLESRDAQAAVQYLRDRLPNERIAALGTSLGGAACLLGDVPLDVDAMILEAVYPDIETAIANRLRRRLGPAGAWLTPLLTWQFRPRIGVGVDHLRPIENIPNQTCPILIIAGNRDYHTTINESRQLFAAAPEPKELWEIEGAGHVDFHAFAPQPYESRVREFLAAHVKTHPLVLEKSTSQIP